MVDDYITWAESYAFVIVSFPKLFCNNCLSCAVDNSHSEVEQMLECKAVLLRKFCRHQIFLIIMALLLE